MNNKLVSVVIPVYNAEKWLNRCLDSILAQTHANFECICVNDGSTDRSGEICDAYSNNDCRIKVIHVANGGVSQARNIGIAHANGEYLLFVDSDDWIEPRHIEKILPIKDECIVFSGFKQYNNGQLFSSNIPEDRICSLEELKENYVYLQRSFQVYYVWCVCYKTEILKTNGILFDTNVELGEDILFNLRYLGYCSKIRFSAESSYCYDNVNATSLVRHYWETRCEKEKKECQETEKFIGRHDYPLRWFYWHVALQHFELWSKRGKKGAQQKLLDTYSEPYFRASIHYMRKNGTLDEKIESFFMSSKLHWLFKPIYSVVVLLYRMKKRTIG